MMAQYLSIKAENPNCLLFYRMGDFYELFFEDAVEASAALDITLTKRGKHGGDDIPMCGVPVYSHESYLSRLIRKGFKVAVCEQTEEPAEAKKRGGAKAVVRRDVVRTITPGTLTEDTLLDSRRNNYLAALAEAQGGFGLAWLDMSTSDFQLQAVTEDTLPAALARLEPGELLLSNKLSGREDLRDTMEPWQEHITVLPASRFDSTNGGTRLQSIFGVKTLDAFGQFSRAEVSAGGALIDYVELTQRGKLPRLSPPRRLADDAVMEIDQATRRNLELTQTLNGERRGSLLSTIDRTQTGAGARALAARLSAPLTDTLEISRRLDAIQHFTTDRTTRESLRDHLRRCPDLERALSRLTVGRGGPRDLASVRDGLALTADILELLVGGALPDALTKNIGDLGNHGELVATLTRALATELPLYARDGGFIAPGFAPRFDEHRELRDESRRLIAGLQDKYAADTGIQNLKIKHNNVLGYFIEVTARHADDLLADKEGPYIHRQTMKNAVRFTTVEVGEMEGRMASAADKALALELELFDELVSDVIAQADVIALAAKSLAELDVAAALAELAINENYCRPVVDDGNGFDIVGGGATPSWKRPFGAPPKMGPPAASSPTIAGLAAIAASGCSPVPTWRVKARSSGKMHSSPSSRRWGATYPPRVQRSAGSTDCFPAWAQRMTWRAGAPRSWWKWWKRRPSLPRPPSAPSSFWMKSDGARPPLTVSPSRGRWSKIYTRSTAAAACSPPTTMSSQT